MKPSWNSILLKWVSDICSENSLNTNHVFNLFRLINITHFFQTSIIRICQHNYAYKRKSNLHEALVVKCNDII